MPKNLEPDNQFVDRLEWQLVSEFRRRDRLRPAAGQVVVPRSVVALGVAAGILLLGVAATKAADLIKDSWRKKIEVARLETQVKIKTAFLGLKSKSVAEADRRFSLGLIREDEHLASRAAVDRSALDLERSRLDLEEVKASGEAPRDELYAPTVRGRDFVSERLEIEKKVLGLDLGWRRARIEKRLKPLVDLGTVSREELDESLASVSVQEAAIGDIEKRLDLRGQFLAKKLSAEELEVQERMTSAEKDRRQAQSMVDSLKKRLSLLQAKENAGVVSKTEVEEVQFGLNYVQAELDLALQEIEILKKIK